MQAYQLLFIHQIVDKRPLTAYFLDNYTVKKLVFLHRTVEDKKNGIYSSAVLIVLSDCGLMLKGGYSVLEGVEMDVVPIGIEQAEDLITQKKTKLYVGNIPHPVDNAMLWKYFVQYGPLDYTYIVKKPAKNGQRGFGYVIYQDRDTVEKVLQMKHSLFNSKLNCKLFMSKGKLKRRGTESDVTEGESNDSESTLRGESDSQRSFDSGSDTGEQNIGCCWERSCCQPVPTLTPVNMMDNYADQGFKKKNVCECIDCPSKNSDEELNDCCCTGGGMDTRTGGCLTAEQKDGFGDKPFYTEWSKPTCCGGGLRTLQQQIAQHKKTMEIRHGSYKFF